VTERALEQGLVVYPSTGCAGADGDVLMVAPPLVTTDAQLEEMVSLLERALGAEGL
jgi:hypothetical protein